MWRLGAAFAVGVMLGLALAWSVLRRTGTERPARPMAVVDEASHVGSLGKSEAAAPAESLLRLQQDPTTPAPTRAALRALLAQNEQLRSEVERLRAQREGTEARRDQRTHGFTHDELLAMAEGCEIAFDHPSTGSGDQPVSVSESEAEEVGIAATGRQAMNDVLRENDRWFRDEVRRIYVMATGDQDGATMLATSSMIEEVQNKSLADDDGSGRRRLARERAGLEKPPSDPRTLLPVEQLLRLKASYGDRVESGMAERIGAEHARRYRDSRHNQSQSRSSGCPE